jgi:hypothetical protein
MIAKAIKGRGFRGALEYDLGKEQGRVVDTNMEGEGPRELAAEFGEIRKLRPKLGKAVLHVSLSAAPSEHLTDDQWREIGQRYLHGMGLDDNQYLITRHDDTDHEHLLINRIRFDGKVTSDSHDYRRHEMLMRERARLLTAAGAAIVRSATSRRYQRRDRTRLAYRRGVDAPAPAAAMRCSRELKSQLQRLCGASGSGRREASADNAA